MIDTRADLLEDAYPFEDRHDAQARAWGVPENERDLTEYGPADAMWFGQPGARELRAMQVHGSPTETPTKGRSRQAASSSDGAAKSSPAARRRAVGDKSGRALSTDARSTPSSLSPAGGSMSPAGRGGDKKEAA